MLQERAERIPALQWVSVDGIYTREGTGQGQFILSNKRVRGTIVHEI